MMMPSDVRRLRILFRRRLLYAALRRTRELHRWPAPFHAPPLGRQHGVHVLAALRRPIDRAIDDRPSRIAMTRAANAAMSCSWVTRMMVIPCVVELLEHASSPRRDVAVSRFPVGSSARMMDGFVTSARAIATRCCSPPESCVRVVCHPVGEPHALERLDRRSSSDRRSGRSDRRRSGSSTFSSGARPREQIEPLEHEADLAVPDVGELVGGEPAHVGAVQAGTRPRSADRGTRGGS